MKIRGDEPFYMKLVGLFLSVYLKKVMIKKVIKSCKIYNHINILQEARDIHDVPRLGLKEFIDYSLRILSQSVNIV
jgi:hypothetical protein